MEPQSRSSVESFGDIEDKMRVVPSMNEIRTALEEKKSNVMLDQRYLSSEEALSPLETDMELSPLEPDIELSDSEAFIEHEADNRDVDDEMFEVIRNSILDLATVVIIRPVGRPKVIDVPPSPKSCFSEASSSQQSISDKEGEYPTSTSRDSGTSFTQLSTSSSGENTPFQQSTSYSKYSLDSTNSEASSPGWEPNVPPTLTIRPPPKAAFLCSDPFATGHESYNVIATRPVTPNPPTVPVKLRHERSSKRITTLKKRPKTFEPELGTNSDHRLSSSSDFPPVLPLKVPRLEARGAAVRETTIVIPPYPYDSDDELMSPVSPTSFFRKPLLRRRGLLLASA